jgi:hypothetical protein
VGHVSNPNDAMIHAVRLAAVPRSSYAPPAVTKETGIVTAQGSTMIVDVAGRAMVVVGAAPAADAHRPVRGVLLD